ncbi:MAG: lipoyl(octanoyl) transferase LipB [Phycisphaerae bacterium]|nr:lipoyl(octanoyl) transferase LipB [Phycisphaerae bacterium]
MGELAVMDIGRTAYEPALELQKRLVQKVRQSDQELAYLILVEHDPPVITAGRGRGLENILASRRQLADMGIEVHETTRGGDVTYHGPGQIVGYPIIRIDRHGRDVHKYLRDIEQMLIRAVGRFGVSGGRREGLTGIWVGSAKLAAIGVAVSRWVSYHGFALNVTTDLSQFATIVPCGLRDESVTSMEALLGRNIRANDVRTAIVECMLEVFGFESSREAEIEPQNAR